MRKNVGTVDATIRITLGLLGLAYGIGKMSRKPRRAPWFLMTMSAMKVAEGITRFCPMLYAFGSNTVTKAGVNAMMGNMAEGMMEAGRQAAQQPKQAGKQASPAKPGEPSDPYSRDEHLYPTYS
jgi:hypothetical protein